MEYIKDLVSVIMSNYNTPEEFLREAIESILNQTYTNFEFIIIDDCSTDSSLDIIKSFNDDRIIIIENKINIGITKSLNKGLATAKGEFIARMDADDICLPERLEKQVRYMKEHPQFIVCGCGIELIGSWEGRYSNRRICRKIPEREIHKIHLLFGNHINIVHPTAMFRHQMLIANGIKYDEKYMFAQDFKMWVECSKYGECQNLDEVLFNYRVHDNAVTVSKKELQKECAKNIMAEQLNWLNLQLPNDWENLHWGLLKDRKPYDLHQKEWIKKIVKQNKELKVYNQVTLKKLLWGKWAETTYFALAKERNPVKIIRALFNLPIRYWGELLKIRKSRQKKEW